MVGFASLFLGLVLGPQVVALNAGEGVAAIELYLDDSLVASLEAPPWAAECDFGPALEPHHLVAVALDRTGRELDRVEQWVNLLRPAAVIEVMVHPGVGGMGTFAQVAWESTVAIEPNRTSAWLDGEPIEVQNPRRIELPDVDPKQLHLLRVEMVFSDNIVSTAERTFGSPFADRVESSLTAVPVQLRDRHQLPNLPALQDWFLENGTAIRVVAVEEGPAEVVVVRDQAALGALDRLARQQRARLRRVARNFGQASTAITSAPRFTNRLKEDLRVRFLPPVATREERGDYNFELFSPSESFTAKDVGFFWLLTHLRPTAGPEGAQRLADAVAAAGMAAAGGNRRRAVVLVLSNEAKDASTLAPSLVRNYLAALRVPLFVWRLSGVTDSHRNSWGDVRDVSTLSTIGREIKHLVKVLEQQRVVWLEGSRLPHRIALSDHATDVTAIASDGSRR